MLRTVSSHLAADVAAPALVGLLVAVADGVGDRQETLEVTVDGRPVEVRELRGPHGARLHRVQAPAGRLVVDYRATVRGQAEAPATDELDLLAYLRPSRYAPSDALAGMAARNLAGLSGTDLVTGAARWVHENVAYVLGSSSPTDGAAETLLSGQGVCRDFAHSTVALLRALDVPARLTAVYAPGLQPMDFHAVTEAWADGSWWVVDSTRLAPRQSLLRISTGRDAADTAFMSTYHAPVELTEIEVMATVDGDLPRDDHAGLVVLR